ncbi:MAG: STAS domain-containing protein [Spirochaetes bacterium]|nr:STAS domain-containing protein [Spirochaetota bacterium]
MLVDFEILKDNESEIKSFKDLTIKMRLVNKLDQSNVYHFDVLCNILMSSGAQKFLFDLNDLEYIDSSGIGRIIKFKKSLNKPKSDVVMARVPQNIMKIFKIVKIDTIIKIFLSVDEAENYLKLI